MPYYQSPFIASARQPVPFTFRVPFTYQAPARNPFTYHHRCHLHIRHQQGTRLLTIIGHRLHIRHQQGTRLHIITGHLLHIKHLRDNLILTLIGLHLPIEIQ